MDIHSSRHNPNFCDRTLSQRLEIEAQLIAFRRQLNVIVKTEDQAALSDLHARVKTAGEGFVERVPRQPTIEGYVWHDEAKRVAVMKEVEAVMAREKAAPPVVSEMQEVDSESEEGCVVSPPRRFVQEIAQRALSEEEGRERKKARVE
ncbi:uncharacterized protein LTR77_001125 [Saxophila tyrrhenica]|uniref:Uncharacterized protein n=1 Tax=Saxophila tyrrhenica TaxID=1690608 RepID=A0AAV9PJX9_9PEZI|nr:hypothetical protein LTR77_001125 [Saxophila tyrrhenica]